MQDLTICSQTRVIYIKYWPDQDYTSFHKIIIETKLTKGTTDKLRIMICNLDKIDAGLTRVSLGHCEILNLQILQINYNKGWKPKSMGEREENHLLKF